MIPKEELRKCVLSQKEELDLEDSGIKRELGIKETAQIVILSGIRRAGKSTLMKQMIKRHKSFNYFNFEDPRVAGFEINDFQRLKEIFEEEHKSELNFFDEIQNVNEWERFARQLHDQKAKVAITGSNASLLSRELGTKLTGRYLAYEVFPFSYTEFLVFRKKSASPQSFEEYVMSGGFPEFLKEGKSEYHRELYSGIINRDIIVRHKLKEGKTIVELGVFLITNVGKEFSYNKLKALFDLGSATTVSEYVSYLEDSYVIFAVPKFEFSYKKQIKNPKKVYCIDTGLMKSISASHLEDRGRYLENAVYLFLRRKYKEIFYFKGKRECDFIVKEGGKVVMAVQVCYELNSENLERELEGLKEAMAKLKLKEGLIITFKEEDKFENVKVIPAWKWMSQ
ncbi:MAG: ATP-binding protein [Candidatus Nanoarchaeia archaeon]